METSTACPTSTATIMACKKIVKSLSENIFELSNIRPCWSIDYGKRLYVRINEIIAKHYADSLNAIDDKHYRDWREVLAVGLQSLKVLRAELKVDFKEDKDFLDQFFNKLGYDEYFSDAKNGNFLSLYYFLDTFSRNLDQTIRKKVTDKGVPDMLFQKILLAAEEMEIYKSCFEKLAYNVALEEDALQEVNDVYEIVQGVCRIASAYYQFDPVKRDQFNFYKVMINL